MSSVAVGEPDACWPWKLSVGSHGYGQVGWSLGPGAIPPIAMTTAHRVVWMRAFGPIPDDLTVDHRCHNLICCNPAHLRLLLNPDNARDNGQLDKTHCPAGHAYDVENTYVDSKGYRHCRACGREGKRARRARARSRA